MRTSLWPILVMFSFGIQICAFYQPKYWLQAHLYALYLCKETVGWKKNTLHWRNMEDYLNDNSPFHFTFVKRFTFTVLHIIIHPFFFRCVCFVSFEFFSLSHTFSNFASTTLAFFYLVARSNSNFTMSYIHQFDDTFFFIFLWQKFSVLVFFSLSLSLILWWAKNSCCGE